MALEWIEEMKHRVGKEQGSVDGGQTGEVAYCSQTRGLRVLGEVSGA